MKAALQRKLFVISGPSGVGKTTIYKRLFEDIEGLSFSVSVTTRKKRSGEQDGVDYQFVDKQRFLQLLEEDAFAEWAEVHGNLYGTLKQELEDKAATSRVCVVDVDVQGARSLRDNYPLAHFVFIAPPSIEELEKRLRKRKTESEAALELRIWNARKELEAQDFFDYVVVNADLDSAYTGIKQIILSGQGA